MTNLFHAARYGETAKLALAMTARFPDYAYGWKSLGAAYKALGRNADAVAPMKKAAALLPGDAEAHSNLGVILRDLGRLDEAAASCSQAVRINPDWLEAHINLGFILHSQGNSSDALTHFREGLRISPSSFVARQGISMTLESLVPQWHVPMMNDRTRNDVYFSAMKSAIDPNAQVLEIGTGSGLLAMMAAKLGAERVTTCEAQPLIAATAKGVVADNGYDATVNVVSKLSFNVDLGVDLPRKADILVTETFSSELLGEHALASIADAKRRLLKPEGRIIPAAGSVMIALFGGEHIGKYLLAENAFGFNLERFNSIVSRKRTLSRSDLGIEILSDDVEAFRFDFEGGSAFPDRTKILRIPITSPGRCYGAIQWIRLQMDKNLVFENHPSAKDTVSGWQHCAFVFPRPVDIKPGQIAMISASHNQSVLWFELDEIA